MDKNKVLIVIPTHKSKFSNDELISLCHLNHYLGKYDRCFVIPDNINQKELTNKGFQTIKFNQEYFTSVPKYCELLNLKEFYHQFIQYDYILIYHLDALVFSSDLNSWCKRGYDYIGAPWFHPQIGNLSYKKGCPISGGNGGLSLRKVKSFIKVIEIAESLAKRSSDKRYWRKLWFLCAVITNNSHRIWLNAPPYCYPFNEDGFWSYEAPKYLSKFKVAPFKTALEFAFEKNPRLCYSLNSNKLPFGCHAWTKYDRNFWESYLIKY